MKFCSIFESDHHDVKNCEKSELIIESNPESNGNNLNFPMKRSSICILSIINLNREKELAEPGRLPDVRLKKRRIDKVVSVQFILLRFKIN